MIERTVVVQSPDEDPLKVDIRPEPTRILGERVFNDEALMEREG